MRHIAIVGSGPAGYYTAEGCRKTFGSDCRIDVIDKQPVPYGLIRTGVAPDHQSIKGVSRRYEAVAVSDNVRFVGNVAVGVDVTIDELRGLYDAVVLATGAPLDRPLGVPGADLPGVAGSAAFVGWYNGHTDFAGLGPSLDGPGAVVIGNGNVALDVARILAKAEAEFDGKAERVIVERTALDEKGAAHGTGETYAIPASLVVSCIGYRTPPITGVPYDVQAGRFANDEGRVLPGLYAVGWAQRGPSGTIGTNRPDGFAVAEKIGDDGGAGGKAGGHGLDALLDSRGVAVVTFNDWQKIDAAENAAARSGSPREKFTSIEALLAARDG
jgi:NADPH-dependent glutamate synthase beta subunit-like oxidoreductase